MDEDVVEARRRGLTAVQLAPLALGAGALQAELAALGGAPFDAVVFHEAPTSGGADSDSDSSSTIASSSGLPATLWEAESLGELRRVLKSSGRLCVQAAVGDEAAVRRKLTAAGFTVRAWRGVGQGAVRLVARSDPHPSSPLMV